MDKESNLPDNLCADDGGQESDGTDDTEEIEQSDTEEIQDTGTPTKSPLPEPQPQSPEPRQRVAQAPSVIITGSTFPATSRQAPNTTPPPGQVSSLFKDNSRSPRSPYKCNKCGQPKRGHICLAMSKVSTTATFSAFKSSNFRNPESEAESSPTSPTNSPVMNLNLSPQSPAQRTSTSKSPSRRSPRFSPKKSTPTQPPVDLTTPVATTNISDGSPVSDLSLGSPLLRSSGSFMSSIMNPPTIVPAFQEIPVPNPPASTVGSVLFAMGWFDMAISALDSLAAHLHSHTKSNWPRLDQLIAHLGEEREYLESMRAEFQVEASLPPEEVSFLGKRTSSILRDFGDGTNLLPGGLSFSDLDEEPARKILRSFE